LIPPLKDLFQTLPTSGDAQVAEDYPLQAVPLTARQPIWSLAPLLMGFTLTSTTLLAGGIVSPAFRFWPDLVVLILVSNLLLGTYCAGLAYIAYRSGLTTVLMARFSFGDLGSRWVDFLLGFTQIGGYAVTTAFAAQALTQAIGVTGTGHPPWHEGLIVFLTYTFCLTAYIGYRAMDWLSRVAVPSMLVLIVLCLGLGLHQVGGLPALQAIHQSRPTLPLGEAITVVVATFISGGTQATNWSRFADSGRNAVVSTLLAFTGINGLLVFVGAFFTLVYGSQDVVGAMAGQGFWLAGLILLILNVWTTQDNTIYAFSIAGANLFRTSKRHLLVLGGATVSLILVELGVYENLMPYLLLLGTFIPPIGGVIMADFWVRHQGKFPDLDQSLPAFNWAGIIAYSAAAGLAYESTQLNWGIAPINGVWAAAIFYVLLLKALPQLLNSGATISDTLDQK